MYQPENGAQYPKSRFGQSLMEIAELFKADVGLEVAFLDSGGWDHHVNEGGVQGQLSNLLRDLGQGIAAFHQDMGDRMGDVVFVSMSEFGRTAHENGNRGTDHGHANCMFVMGGGRQRREGLHALAGLEPKGSSTRGATSPSPPTIAACSAKSSPSISATSDLEQGVSGLRQRPAPISRPVEGVSHTPQPPPGRNKKGGRHALPFLIIHALTGP